VYKTRESFQSLLRILYLRFSGSSRRMRDTESQRLRRMTINMCVQKVAIAKKKEDF
jgi:hypothetical protein